VLQLDPEGVAGIKLAGFMDQDVGEIGEDALVAMLIRIGQGTPGDIPAESKMVQPLGCSVQACFDVAQALSIRELGEGQREILIPAAEAPYAPVSAVPFDAAPKRIVRCELHELSKDGASLIHRSFLCMRVRQDG